MLAVGLGTLLGGIGSLYGAYKQKDYTKQAYSNDWALAQQQRKWAVADSDLAWEREKEATLVNYNMAREAAEQQYNYQRQLIEAQNSYNSPENQMARLKAAGLNPNLVYGSVSSGNQSSAGSAPSIQVPSPASAPTTRGVSMPRTPIKQNQLASVLTALGDTMTSLYNIKKSQEMMAFNQNKINDELAFKAKQLDLQQQRNEITEKNLRLQDKKYNLLLSQWATNAKYQYETMLDRREKFKFETNKAGYIKNDSGTYEKKNWWLRLLDNVFGSKYF